MRNMIDTYVKCKISHKETHATLNKDLILPQQKTDNNNHKKQLINLGGVYPTIHVFSEPNVSFG